MSERDLIFFNRRGQRLAAVLHLPDDTARPAPAVLLCQGLSGVKHLVLPEVAKSLADQGFASLRFDYAGCGESEGEPGWVDPPARVEDALYAFARLAALDGVDPHRIGVYGHSYGGPVGICLAAQERRARAIVSVSGPGDGPDLLRSLRASWDWVAFRERLEAERAKVAATGEASEVGIEELFPFSPAFLAAYERLKASAGGSSAMQGSTQTYRLASADAMLALRPGDAARHLGGRPLLLVHGENDDAAVIETIEPVYANAPGPKRWARIPGAGHNDLDGGPGLKDAIQLAADWFATHLV